MEIELQIIVHFWLPSFLKNMCKKEGFFEAKSILMEYILQNTSTFPSKSELSDEYWKVVSWPTCDTCIDHN